MIFFKLYTAPKGRVAPKNITLYYRGCPLYTTAVFDNGRYVFQLPLNLRDKMITGNMCADLRFSGEEKHGTRVRTPEALILSDRYD